MEEEKVLQSMLVIQHRAANQKWNFALRGNISHFSERIVTKNSSQNNFQRDLKYRLSGEEQEQVLL